MKKKKKKAWLAQSGESAPPQLTGTAANDNPSIRMMLLMTMKMIKRTAHPQPMNCYSCSRTLPANRQDGRQEEVGRETGGRHGRDRENDAPRWMPEAG